LTHAGYTVVTARDSEEALRVSDPCGVLVTDLLMPRMTGDELARRLRQRDPNVKVLYLTGYSEQLFAIKQVLEDGEAFLDKPASGKEVLEAIELLLTDRRIARTL
jgi:CheY-like chemotaxis protein